MPLFYRVLYAQAIQRLGPCANITESVFSLSHNPLELTLKKALTGLPQLLFSENKSDTGLIKSIWPIQTKRSKLQQL